MLTPAFWTRVALGLAVLFAAVNVINALNKGGDAAIYFEGGRRLLQAAPLYEGSSAAAGFIGPPFQALFFAPFAAIDRVSPVTAKLTWHFLNVACLVAGVWLTARTWWEVRSEVGLPARPWFPTLFAPLLAVLLPVQTNFEHQNMNALLLALVAGATWQLTAASAIAAGILIGFASALKAFPALLIGFLLMRRRWAAAATAVATAVILTLLPMLVYGSAEYSNLLQDFLRLAQSGWPARGNNQSLVAAVDRLLNGFDLERVGERSSAPDVAFLSDIATNALVLTMIVAIVLFVIRSRAWVPIQMAAVTTIAILLSPIAWDHYWTLLLPGFLIVYESQDRALLGRGGRAAFWIAALLTTGLSPLTLGSHGFNLARDISTFTLAALIVYAALITLSGKLWKRERAQ
jgi:alpha-1,2-mannosyltransferase